MSRTINFSLPKFGPCPNDQVLAWARANGLDPNDIPLNQFIVEDDVAGTITVVEFARDENGKRQLVHDPETRYIKTTRTVPLVATLESFNL